MVIFLAIKPAHVSRSFRVYPTTVGLPVVPEVVWMRTISCRGTAKNPKGYPSRRSCFRVKGSFSTSSSVFMSPGTIPASFSCLR